MSNFKKLTVYTDVPCEWVSVAAPRNDKLDQLEAENAKLRELVRELWEGYADPPCEDCPLKDKPACVDCPICAREAAVIDHMHELGVEVDNFDVTPAERHKGYDWYLRLRELGVEVDA